MAEMKEYNPSLRERTQQLIAQLLQRTGMSSYEANRHAYGFTGQGSNAIEPQIGLLDFTPAGLVYGLQDGARSIERGRNIGGVDGAIEGGLGLLEVGLSATPAAFTTAALVRGGRKAARSKRDK